LVGDTNQTYHCNSIHECKESHHACGQSASTPPPAKSTTQTHIGSTNQHVRDIGQLNSKRVSKPRRKERNLGKLYLT
jgi:hypothetical protein